MVHERFSGCFVLESRTKLNFSFNFGKRLHGTTRTIIIQLYLWLRYLIIVLLHNNKS